MTTHPFETLDPIQRVQVLPRYLAGPGRPALRPQQMTTPAP